MRNFHTLTVCLWKTSTKTRTILSYAILDAETFYVACAKTPLRMPHEPIDIQPISDETSSRSRSEGRRGQVKRKHPVIQKAMDAISTIRCCTASLADFREYLRIRGLHTPLLRDFYAQSHCRQWKWKTYQYDQQSNDRLVSKIRQHFGPGPLLIIGIIRHPSRAFTRQFVAQA